MTDPAILRQLFAAYPNSQATVETIAIYDRLLSDIPTAELQTVIDQAIAECRFLPTVAELRERYHVLTRTLGTPSAAEAWGEVVQQIRAVGYIGEPCFANELTARVVRMMGWRELCASENVVADRAHFMKMYGQLIERGEQLKRLLPQSIDMAERHMGHLTHISAYLPTTEDRPYDRG